MTDVKKQIENDQSDIQKNLNSNDLKNKIKWKIYETEKNEKKNGDTLEQNKTMMKTFEQNNN